MPKFRKDFSHRLTMMDLIKFDNRVFGPERRYGVTISVDYR